MWHILKTHKTYVWLFCFAFVTCYLLVPLVKRLALRLKAFDPPSERRHHRRSIPTLGGLAVAAPLYAGIALLYLWPNLISERFFVGGRDVLGLLLGAFLILLLGVRDDLHGAGASTKFPVQIVAALVVCFFSGSIESLRLPVLGDVKLGIAAVPATVFWIVAITNAFNLIDGIDGLAAGVGSLVCGVSFFLAYMFGHTHMMVLAALMAGSLLAFLRFNFYPARIFLGDTGSLFVGFVIGVVSLQSSMKAPTAVLMLVPVCVLGYPLLDTLLAVVRRLLKGKPIFSSDRSHIHHKLLGKGFGHRTASMAAYGLTVLFTLVAICHIYGRHREAGFALALVTVILVVMFKAFGYWDFVRNHLSLALRRKYRIYNLLEKLIALKMDDARDMDELWRLVCQVGHEFDLLSMRLRAAGGDDRAWHPPGADGRSEAAVREFPLGRTAATLRISHDDDKGQDMQLEQDLLLEKLSDSLARNMERIQRGSQELPSGSV